MKGILLVFIFTLLSFGTSNENSSFLVEPYSLLRIRSEDKSNSNLDSGETPLNTPPPPPPLPPTPDVSSRPNSRQVLLLNISITKVRKFIELLEKVKTNYQVCEELLEWLFELLKSITQCLKDCINSTESCKHCLESIKQKLETRKNEEVKKGTEGICIDLIDVVLQFVTNIMEFKMTPLTIPSTTTSTSTSAPISTAE